MGDEPEKKMLKRICAGLLAHVDAGKTTLSEALLYESGQLRRLGRVDHRDAFLDTDAQERERGIPIFSKQARLSLDGLDLTLLDTPGHVDFSSEMERTLQVLDYAILVISGTDGVQGHTATLWRPGTTSPPSCSSTRWTWRARTGPPCWSSCAAGSAEAVWTSLPRTGRKVPPCATTVFWRSIWKRGTWMTGM